MWLEFLSIEKMAPESFFLQDGLEGLYNRGLFRNPEILGWGPSGGPSENIIETTSA